MDKQTENFNNNCGLEDLLQNLSFSEESKITPPKDEPENQLLQVPLERHIPAPIPIYAETSLLGLETLLHKNIVVEYKPLSAESLKYKEILRYFPSNLQVLRINEILNPFIKLSFQLKQHFIYSDITPMKLFHGTKQKHVHNICSYNFDWRYSGTERGHRCGKGVNFTPYPWFATNFCDKSTAEMIVILADVLKINEIIGSPNLDVPPEGYDTAIRLDRKTYVKFCDAEFNPQYVIYFCKRRPLHKLFSLYGQGLLHRRV